jgi:hypothetical protein
MARENNIKKSGRRMQCIVDLNMYGWIWPGERVTSITSTNLLCYQYRNKDSNSIKATDPREAVMPLYTVVITLRT